MIRSSTLAKFTRLAMAACAGSCVNAAELSTDFSTLITVGEARFPAGSSPVENGVSAMAASQVSNETYVPMDVDDPRNHPFVMTTGDFNCDGSADIALSDTNVSIGGANDAGRIAIAFGDRLLPVKPDGQSLDQNTSGVAGTAEAQDFFGSALVTADFNADGCGDLAVGVKGEDVGSPSIDAAGGVAIFRGSLTGLRVDNDLFLPGENEAAPHGPAQNHQKGASLAVLNHFVPTSNLPMLAIGTPGHSPFLSTSAGGASIRRSDNTPGDLIVPVTFIDNGTANFSNIKYDELGSRAASGDFNHDGYDDLVLAGNNEDSDGHLLIAYGADRLSAVRYEQIDQDSPGVPGAAETLDMFGQALAVGDFNSDGFDDLAVGVPEEDIGDVPRAGAVVILFGSSAGLLLNTASSIALHADDFPGSTVHDSDRFGFSLASGDFNRDTFDDLVIGSPNAEVGTAYAAGAVLLAPGSENGPAPSMGRTLSMAMPGMPGVPQSGSDFGEELAVGDFNADNIDDLAILIPALMDSNGHYGNSVLMLYSVSDTITEITSITPSLGAPGTMATVHVKNMRMPINGLPRGRGDVTVTTSEGESCVASIATNGLGTCTLIVHDAGIVTFQAHYPALLGFRASDAAPFVYSVVNNDTIFHNGFDITVN